jgi:hypothetical protein
MSSLGIFSTFPFLFAWVEKNKGHNMLALMLDPRFKSLWLVTSYIGHEKASSLVVQYDVGFLLPLLI